MDSVSEEVNTRQISQNAAERYARPPPPVPVGVHGPTPPPRPPHLPERAPHTGGYGVSRSHRDPPHPPLVPNQVIPVHRDSVPITYRGVDRGPTHVEIPHHFSSVPITVAPSSRGLGNRQVDSTQSRSLNTSLRPQRDLVTLAGMRKHRARNEYTETPSLVRVQTQNNNNDKALQLQNSRTSGLESQLSPRPIIHQPGSSALKKEIEQVDLGAPCQESIICAQCGKCRCSVCMQQRPLPSRWICRNKCECSAQKCVEYCTCLWLVKGIFYHCLKDRQADEEFQLDEPCACCDQPHCCKRWTCMAAMSLCLPCLCFYGPLQCCLGVCTSCYNHGRGCRCRKDKIPGSKGLLLDSESSSA